MLNMTNHRDTNENYNEIITSHLSEWPPSINQQTTRAGEAVEKGDPRALLVGTQTGAATVESSMEFPQKTCL